MISFREAAKLIGVSEAKLDDLLNEQRPTFHFRRAAITSPSRLAPAIRSG